MIGQSVHLELGETQKIPRHMHMGIELFFLLRGEVDLELGGEVYRMRRDDVILCNQREICGAEGVGPNVMFRVLIPGDVLKEESDTLATSGLEKKQAMSRINHRAKAWLLPRLAKF